MSQDETSLEAIFERCNQDGTPRYSSEDIRHQIPYLLFRLAVPTSTMSGPVLEMYGQFVLDAALDLKAGPQTVREQIEAYYNAHPGNLELRSEILRCLAQAEIQAGADASDSLGRAARAIGIASPPTLKQSGDTSGPRGPLARFEFEQRYRKPDPEK